MVIIAGVSIMLNNPHPLLVANSEAATPTIGNAKFIMIVLVMLNPKFVIHLFAFE